MQKLDELSDKYNALGVNTNKNLPESMGGTIKIRVKGVVPAVNPSSDLLLEISEEF